MILVLLGTQNNSFHRLLEELDKLIDKRIITDEVVVQAGHTKYKSKNMKIFGLVSLEEIDSLIDKADLIITHGGVGSIMSSLRKKKKVVAIPRLHVYNEHVNDHQKEIVETFDKKGYIIGIKGVEELESVLEKIKQFEPKYYKSDNQKMLKIIRDFIDNI